MKTIWGILMDAFFVAVLLWCSYTDLKSRTVSNMSVGVLVCLGLGHMVLVLASGSIWWVYPAGMLLGIPFLIAWLKGGMGGGDVKLIIAIGFYLGLQDTLVAFILMVPVLIIMVIYSWNINSAVMFRIPLVPVLSLGAIGIMISRVSTSAHILLWLLCLITFC